ncbi:MAG TPA: carboxypeptidase-like regulatory domain-containing protein [Acidisarcina sp.]
MWVALFALAAVGRAAATFVEVRSIPDTSAHVRIAVTLAGKPLRRAKVAIYPVILGQADPVRPRFVLRANDRGMVELRTLPAGYYHATAHPREDLKGNLYFRVALSDIGNPTMLTMELARVTTLADVISASEAKGDVERVGTFSGVVRDVSGASIPEVSIEVMRRGTMGQTFVARLKSGAAGEFRAKLNAGRYVAMFQAQGFMTRIVTFDIVPVMNTRDLDVVLGVGEQTE